MTPENENHPHSEYGASKAKTWRLCTASVAAVRKAKEEGKIPKSKSSVYADEGTEAHNYAEACLLGKIPVEEIPEQFRVHLEGYIAHCRAIEAEAEKINVSHVTHFDPLNLVEKKVPLFYRSTDRGTVDHAVISPAFIHITDLKYGVGVKVDAEENDQAMIYAMSLIDELVVMEGLGFAADLPVFISIYQPRHRSFTGEPDTWETTVGALREFSRGIVADYEAAKTNGGEEGFNPSDAACMFCDLKGICCARAKTSFGGLPAELDVGADFDFETDSKPGLPTKKKDYEKIRETLTPGQIAWICKNGGTIKKIIENVIAAEIERIQAGGEINEMKLVAGNPGNRAWVDTEAAEKLLRSLFGAGESYKPRVLLTAPQAIAKAKNKVGEMSTMQKIKLGFAEETEKTKCFIHRPEGKPKLVPADAPGEALNFCPVEDDFEDESDISDLL